VNAGLDEVEAVPFSCIDLSELPAAEQETAKATAAELQASLNLAEGPLLRVALLDLGRQPAEPTAISYSSPWWMANFTRGSPASLPAAQPGEAVQLPLKTTSFKQWSEFLQEYAHSPGLQQECDYWVRPPASFSPACG